jgi:hypothetical protein
VAERSPQAVEPAVAVAAADLLLERVRAQAVP